MTRGLYKLPVRKGHLKRSFVADMYFEYQSLDCNDSTVSQGEPFIFSNIVRRGTVLGPVINRHSLDKFSNGRSLDKFSKQRYPYFYQ